MYACFIVVIEFVKVIKVTEDEYWLTVSFTCVFYIFVMQTGALSGFICV